MRFVISLVIFLIALPLLFMTAFEHGLLDDYVQDDDIPVDPFIRAELSEKTTSADLSRRIDEALDNDAYDDAAMYAEIAAYMDMPVAPATQVRLEAENAFARRAARNTGSFVTGFVTGTGDDTPAFMGAVASDLTVIGDIRDIGSEGSKLVRGEEYSTMILGLSVVGLAATTATVATGGAGLPARVGVSVLKVARKAGTVTTGFARDVTRLLQEAMNGESQADTVGSVDLADTTATRRAISNYAEGVATARVMPVVDGGGGVGRAPGAAEAVSLM